MTRLVLRFLLAVVSSTVLPLLPTAYAQPAPPNRAKLKQAKSYVDAGLAAQGGGDYDTAITFYSKAYELFPHPVLLFNIAQAHRLAGRVDEAVKFYQNFLATNPTGAEAQITRDLLVEIAKRKAEQTRRVEQATKARQDGRFEDARVELEGAYALDPQPDLLYALGQVYAKLGNCGEAITYYKRFIGTQKDLRVTNDVDREIAACRSVPPPVRKPPQPPNRPRSPADQQPPSSDRPPQPAVSRPSPPLPSTVTVEKPTLPQDEQSPVRPLPQLLARTRPAPTPAGARQGSPWYKDNLGHAFVLGGAAATVVALIEYRGALSELNSARQSHNVFRYHELVDSAHNKRTTSVVLAGAGSALIVAGIIHYALHVGTADAHTVGVASIRGGSVVTYEGRF
jgi:tetratricopeptide (TPR) repeat protein